jgi:hypothetical protein
MVRRGVAVIAVILLGTAGCTNDRPTVTVPPTPTTEVPAFGARQTSLNCDDATGLGPDDVIGASPFAPLERSTSAPPARAEDVGLRLPPGLHWYFRKEPLSLPAGTSAITLAVSGADQALAWVPFDVWTAGSPDLWAWAASSVTMHACPDRPVLFLGGLLAERPDTCIALTMSEVGGEERTVRLLLDGSPCGG